MAIQSVEFQKNSFSLTLAWPKGVNGMILYAVPRGQGPHPEDELIRAKEEHLLAQRYGGMNYASGPLHIQYSTPREMASQWVDVYFCDYDKDDVVLRHESAGCFFNDICTVAQSVELIPISAEFNAVHIRLENRSRFPMEPGGIGYRVGSVIRPIPFRLAPGQQLDLPQFEVPAREHVTMARIEGQYPVKYVEFRD